MGLDDPEDNPPLEPSSIPPEPIESFREPADTEPAAAPDLVTQLVEALKPAFAHLELRLDAIADQVQAIDKGVALALGHDEEHDRKLGELLGRAKNQADGLSAISKDLQDLRTSVTTQFDHDGAKRRELEQSVADLQESSEQRLSATGG